MIQRSSLLETKRDGSGRGTTFDTLAVITIRGNHKTKITGERIGTIINIIITTVIIVIFPGDIHARAHARALYLVLLLALTLARAHVRVLLGLGVPLVREARPLTGSMDIRGIMKKQILIGDLIGIIREETTGSVPSEMKIMAINRIIENITVTGTNRGLDTPIIVVNITMMKEDGICLHDRDHAHLHIPNQGQGLKCAQDHGRRRARGLFRTMMGRNIQKKMNSLRCTLVPRIMGLVLLYRVILMP
eukprot:Rmarinus@m.22534